MLGWWMVLTLTTGQVLWDGPWPTVAACNAAIAAKVATEESNHPGATASGICILSKGQALGVPPR